MKSAREPRSSPSDRPTVSILTPAYNEQASIVECMMSVQSQSLIDFEHIIVDDQSTDTTFALARGASDHRTVVLSNPKKGKLAAFKYAFARSRGRFIVLLAADDVLPSDSLQKRVAYMRIEHPLTQPAIARGHLRTFSEGARFDKLVIPKRKRGYFSGGTIIMSRRFAELAFQLPDNLPNEDSWIRLCAEHLHCKVFDSPGVTLHYRIHPNNSSASRGLFEDAVAGYSKREMVAEAFLNHFQSQLSNESKARLQAKLALEEARSKRTLIELLTISGVSVPEKLRAIAFRYKLAYEIRQRFWRLLVGWRV